MNHATAQPASRISLIERLGKAMMSFGRRRNTPGGKFPRHEFTPAQLQTLILIGHSGSVSVKDIAKTMGITSSAATQAVQLLIKRGIVRKTANPDDRRGVRIAFTPKGKKLFTGFRKTMMRNMLATFKPVPDRELLKMILAIEAVSTYFNT